MTSGPARAGDRPASGPRRPGPVGRTRRRTAPAPRAGQAPSPARSRTCSSSARTRPGSSACSRAIEVASRSGIWRSSRGTAAGDSPSRPDSAGPPGARSMTMNARPRPSSGPPGRPHDGVGKPAAATARCTIVSLRAEPGSGISRATSSAGQPAGGFASENAKSSAQNPPRIGSAGARTPGPACRRRSAAPRSAVLLCQCQPSRYLP